MGYKPSKGFINASLVMVAAAPLAAVKCQQHVLHNDQRQCAPAARGWCSWLSPSFPPRACFVASYDAKYTACAGPGVVSRAPRPMSKPGVYTSAQDNTGKTLPQGPEALYPRNCNKRIGNGARVCRGRPRVDDLHPRLFSYQRNVQGDVACSTKIAYLQHVHRVHH